MALTFIIRLVLGGFAHRHTIFPRSIESDKSFFELRIITVLINFNLEKLRSLAADVIGAV